MLSLVTAFAICLAVCSTASALPSRDVQIKNRDIAVTDSELANFKLLAQYSAASYCNVAEAGPLTCASNACPEVTAANAVSTAEFLDPILDIAGLVAVDPTNKLIVVSYRGSNSIRNFLLDVLFLKAPCEFGSGCKAHAGFLASWAVVKAATTEAVKKATAANPGFKLYITGHSMGGAIATLAGASLRNAGYPCDIVTFGSPRVGNDVFANYITSQPGSEHRITHLNDPVPRLPPILFGFRHVSPEYWLSTGTASTSVYTPADIKVCEGIANVECNAGSKGIDLNAHLTYLGPIQVCAANPIQWRDTESEDRYLNLAMYAALDIEYAGALVNGSLPA